MEIPAQCGSSTCRYANTVKTPSAARGLQRGEGLTDPGVLCILEVVGQDSFLVLQLLYEKETDVCM